MELIILFLNDIGEWLNTNFSNILAGLIGSGLMAILFFVFFRPSIRFAEIITFDATENGFITYRFKFYNTSLFTFDNVQMKLMYGKAIEIGDYGTNRQYEKLDLTREDPIVVPPWKLTKRLVRKGFRLKITDTEFADHCITVRCLDQELETKLKNRGDLLELRVKGSHGFSNLTRTMRQKYGRVRCIKKGSFSFGNNNKLDDN